MITNSVKSWADYLVREELLAEENRQNFVYGLTNIVSTVLYTLLAALVAAFLGRVWNVLLFSLCFVIFRQYTGGYHARDRKRCFLASLFVQALHLLLVMLPDWKVLYYALILTGTASVPVVFALAPIVHEKAPLSEIEIAYHRLRSRQIVILIAFASVTVYGLGMKGLALSSLCACTMTALSLIIAKWRLRKC